MEIKCVIFDMDGLMFDTEKIAGMCLKEAASKYGYTVTDEIRFKLLGRSKKDNRKTLKEAFGDDYPFEKISTMSMEIRKDYLNKNGLPVKPGLKNLLQYLKEHNIKTAVASSSNQDLVVQYLKMSGVYDKIDFIIAGDQVSHSKPNPEIFLNVIKHFDIKCNEALVLEDSRSGILAAHNGGIPVICIPDLVKHEDKINDLTLAVLNNLNEVIKYIR